LADKNKADFSKRGNNFPSGYFRQFTGHKV
jgi:hypothetical protein